MARNFANMILRARTEAVKRNKRMSTAFVPASGVNGDLYGVDLNRGGTLDTSGPTIMAVNGVTLMNGRLPYKVLAYRTIGQ